METIKSRAALRVVINPDKNTELSIAGWPINTLPEMFSEPERVGVEKDGKNYSIVFTDDGPVVEVWNVDGNGQLTAHTHTIKLPC